MRERTAKVERQLVDAVERHQRRHGDQAAVALGEPRPLPDLPEEDLVGIATEGRRDVVEGAACRCGSIAH
jgi:hypothetical protein